MATTETELKASRRQLVLRDSLAFLILAVVTAVLFAITLFLFRSFSQHRTDLGRELSQRARVAIAEGRPHDAIGDLREALSYAPGERSYELMLAQALGDDGRLEESKNYFLNLWETKPGDGPINLQLARLSRRQMLRHEAVNYYRSSIYGNWDGDAVTHRRDVRLELANYLIDLKAFSVAQAELQISASNAPAIPDLQIGLGDALVRAQDKPDAIREYKLVMAETPRNAVAFAKAGRLAYEEADYVNARDWLERAVRESAGGLASESGNDPANPSEDITTLLKNSERLLVLDPGRATSRNDHVMRLLNDRLIAKKNFDVCMRQMATQPAAMSQLQAMAARWTASNSISKRVALLDDQTNEDALNALIAASETLTAKLCGPPKGDDALLLLLATRSQTH